MTSCVYIPFFFAEEKREDKKKFWSVSRSMVLVRRTTKDNKAGNTVSSLAAKREEEEVEWGSNQMWVGLGWSYIHNRGKKVRRARCIVILMDLRWRETLSK